MPFPDEVVGGIYLIRFAIRSPNYQAGVMGWTINQDGSAEFSDVVIRGGELLITDPDGSYIRIYDQQPGDGAIIELNPADQPGHTITPGSLRTDSVSTFASLTLDGPRFDGLTSPGITLSSVDAVNPEQFIQVIADSYPDSEIRERAPLWGVHYNSSERFAVDGAATNTELRLDGKELGFGIANIWMLTPPATTTTSATPVTIAGASTATFVKRQANTRVEVTMSAGGYISAGAGASVTFGVLISGGIGDFSIVTGSFSVLSNRIQFSGTRLLSAFAAGSYTITPRWFRSTGTSTVIMDAVDASLSVAIREVMEA